MVKLYDIRYTYNIYLKWDNYAYYQRKILLEEGNEALSLLSLSFMPHTLLCRAGKSVSFTPLGWSGVRWASSRSPLPCPIQDSLSLSIFFSRSLSRISLSLTSHLSLIYLSLSLNSPIYLVSFSQSQ